MSEPSEGPPGPVAVVTGASSGIGREIAIRLARTGYTVAALARQSDRLREIKSADIRAYPCDVTDRVQVCAVAAVVERELGPAHALVNAAGVLREAPVGEIRPDDLDLLLSVNVVGTVNTCQEFLPALRRSRGGIVNISSMLTVRPRMGVAAYAATKGAVEAFSRVAAHELASAGVRVNVISPSLVRTHLYGFSGATPAEVESKLRDAVDMFPLGRIGEPADVADLALFLLSQRAAWMTGAVVPLDGGRAVS